MKTPEQIAADYTAQKQAKRKADDRTMLREAVKAITGHEIAETDLAEDDRGYYWIWGRDYRLRPGTAFPPSARIERLINGEWKYYMCRSDYGGYQEVGEVDGEDDIARAVSYFNDEIQKLQKRKPKQRRLNFRAIARFMSRNPEPPPQYVTDAPPPDPDIVPTRPNL